MLWSDNNLLVVHELVGRMIKQGVLVFFIDLLVLEASRKTLLGWRISDIHLIWFSLLNEPYFNRVAHCLPVRIQTVL